jgi:hypothetical protein
VFSGLFLSQRLHRGTPNDREALDKAHAAPLRAGWGTSRSFRSSSTLASKGTSLAPLKSTGIHVQDMLCLLAASSAYARVIALIPSGIA